MPPNATKSDAPTSPNSPRVRKVSFSNDIFFCSFHCSHSCHSFHEKQQLLCLPRKVNCSFTLPFWHSFFRFSFALLTHQPHQILGLPWKVALSAILPLCHLSFLLVSFPLFFLSLTLAFCVFCSLLPFLSVSLPFSYSWFSFLFPLFSLPLFSVMLAFCDSCFLLRSSFIHSCFSVFLLFAWC